LLLEYTKGRKKGSFFVGFLGGIVSYVIFAIVYYFYAKYHHSPSDNEWKLGISIFQAIYGFVWLFLSIAVGLATRKNEYRKAVWIILGGMAGTVLLMGSCGALN
jgi:hypothetical protein